MATANDMKPGNTILYEDEIYEVLDTEHVKPGKGGAYVKADLRNYETGQLKKNVSFRSSEKIEFAFLEKKEMEYLYRDGNILYFMDTETYEQTPLEATALGDQVQYLKPNELLMVVFYQGRCVGVNIPDFVELEVTKTEPGVRGDTATSVTKPAIVETGFEVKVPLFINKGDILKVDTRTGDYVERVESA